MKRIVVIENDSELLAGLRARLEVEGYGVTTATDGEAGLAQIARSRPDAIVLDLTLKKLGGLDVCRALRDQGLQTPILILSTRHQESDMLLGLRLGADDYVTKPFSIQELVARVEAMICRSTRPPRTLITYAFGDVEVHFPRHEVHKARRRVPFTNLEFDVLTYLIARRGQVVPRDQLLSEVWGYQSFRATRAVDNLVGRLRQKVEDSPKKPRHILSAYGVGYTFVE